MTLKENEIQMHVRVTFDGYPDLKYDKSVIFKIVNKSQYFINEAISDLGRYLFNAYGIGEELKETYFIKDPIEIVVKDLTNGK